MFFDNLKKILSDSLSNEEREPREYLGCSLLGHPCDRLLWYTYKGTIPPTPQNNTDNDVDKTLKKFLRFKLGHLLENLLIAELKNALFVVNRTQEEIQLLDGKVKGHIDGIIYLKMAFSDIPYLLEIKSMNDQRFKILQKKGVKEGFPDYWAQCQLYMKGLRIDAFADQHLNNALFLAINKNTCEIHHETIPYNEKDADGLLIKAYRIFLYESEPPRFTQSGRKVPLICSGCDFFEHCYKETEIDETKYDIST